MSDILSRQYSDTPTTNLKREDIKDFFSHESYPSGSKPTLENIVINHDTVKDALSKLSSKSSPGPDGILANCLKYGGEEMTKFLVTLFQRSMDNTDVPQMIRNGLISPAFKSGDRTLPKNYRPISLTVHL